MWTRLAKLALAWALMEANKQTFGWNRVHNFKTFSITQPQRDNPVKGRNCFLLPLLILLV